MNMVLFIQILSGFGIIGAGFLTAVSIYNWHYYNNTKAGELAVMLMRIRGEKIVGFYFIPRFVVLVISIAAFIASF